MSAAYVAPCDTRPPLHRPQTLCHDHGPQLSGYWICAHILDEGAPAALKLKASIKISGVLLCHHCAEAEVESAQELLARWRGVRLACPTCAHKAGLVDSSEVKL